MGRAIIWTPEKYQRLFAAMLAAHPEYKLNYNSIAGMFGEGATYDSIETRFRQIKKQAKALAEEVASGQRPATAAPTPRKRKAMEQSTDGVQTPDATPQSKRVCKVAPLPVVQPETPTRNRRVVAGRPKRVQVKREVYSDDSAEEERHWSASEDDDDSVGEVPEQDGEQDDTPIWL